MVVYIGASGTKVGGGENNGLHIFHCISVPLCLCICSRWNCICMWFLIRIYILICICICICNILYFVWVPTAEVWGRIMDQKRTHTGYIVGPSLSRWACNTTLHLIHKPSFPLTPISSFIKTPKTLDGRDIHLGGSWGRGSGRWLGQSVVLLRGGWGIGMAPPTAVLAKFGRFSLQFWLFWSILAILVIFGQFWLFYPILVIFGQFGHFCRILAIFVELWLLLALLEN